MVAVAPVAGVPPVAGVRPAVAVPVVIVVVAALDQLVQLAAVEPDPPHRGQWSISMGPPFRPGHSTP